MGQPARLFGCRQELLTWDDQRGGGAAPANVLSCLDVETGIAVPEVLGAAGRRKSGGQAGGNWQSHGPQLLAEAGHAAGTLRLIGW